MRTIADKSVRQIAFACLAVSVVTLLWQARYYWHYINDDAYITFRYSRFLALGRGPYFNIGEHVEGYTNVLLMLLTSGFIRIFGADGAPVAAKMVGVLSACGCAVLAFAITRRLLKTHDSFTRTAPLWAAAAAGIVAVNPSFALNSTSGLETALFSLCLALGVYAGIGEMSDRRWRGSGLAFGAAVLTRPEGIVLFAAFWLAQAFVHLFEHIADARRGGTPPAFRSLLVHPTTKILIVNGAVVTVIFGGLMLFRHLAYDGEWLPNTYYAKERDVEFRTAQAYVEFGMLPAVFSRIGIAVALAGYAAQLKRVRPFIPVGCLAALGCIMPFLSGTDWMLGARLAIPYLPLLAVFVVCGWALLATAALRRYAWPAPVIAVALVAVLWFRQDDYRETFHHHITLRGRGYHTGHIALADWLRLDAAKPGDTVALMDIGLVGYRCIDQQILDLTGLTDRFIAKSPGGFLDKRYDLNYVLEQRPEFIVLALTAKGTSYEPPPPDTEFRFWTGIEKRIYDDPDFQANYVTIYESDSDGLDAIAARLGADRIFEHGHPGLYYLLAVFKRQVPSTGPRT